MKMKLFYSTLFSLCLLSVLAQDNAATCNLNKYWYYRERLKNFVVAADCRGCGIPAIYISSDNSRTRMEWSDATQSIGLYVSVLATEYHLLKEKKQSTDETIKELYYALEAVNRLDLVAERSWDIVYNKKIYKENFPEYYHRLNGFFVKDDVDTNFVNQSYLGKPIWWYLNSSSITLSDTLIKPLILSGYTAGIYDTHFGPREESIDQVIVMLMGYALISKYIDSNVVYLNKAFTDGELSILKEARLQAGRIVKHIRDNEWLIRNPVMEGLVQGVQTQRHYGFQSPGGGNVKSLAFGVQLSENYIQYGKESRKEARKKSYRKFPSSRLKWRVLKHIPIGLEDYKVQTLAAIGNAWGNGTMGVLERRAKHSVYAYYHIPLLHGVLYNKQTRISDSVYINMLNKAPCYGTNGYCGVYDWSNSNGGGRVVYGPNISQTQYKVETPGLDYMLYFNLYAIMHPDYVGNFYTKSSIEKIKSNFDSMCNCNK